MNNNNDAAQPPVSPPFSWRALAIYGLMLAAAVGLFLLIGAIGETLAVPEGTYQAQHRTAAPKKTDALPQVLLALAAVILIGRVLGKIFIYLGQPQVIAEVIAGILLGPSLLGRLAPEAYDFIFPESVVPFLGVLAQLGVILYMFLIGLELNTERLRSQARATVAISQASIMVPFLFGAILALGFYGTQAPGGVSFTSFALFMGIALSVTAFPVLARILTDRGMTRSELGVLALSCAGAADITAWCLLAFVVGVTQSTLGSAVLVVLLSLAYVAFMFVLIRPAANRIAWRYQGEDLPRGVFALVLLGLLLSALATEAIGIHAVFGAFLFGAVIPHDSAVARAFSRKLEDVVTVLFLPAFFAFTGMRTQIGLVAGWQAWLSVGLIILVATAGKFGGTLLAARLTGLNWRTAAALGVLMNTRGLMELIVLNIGLDLGVISPTLFAMMVLMALVTTLATTPLLAWLKEGERKLPISN